MCRLIYAHGNFDPRRILQAALDMGHGRTATHDGPIRCHPNGWGVVWKDAGQAHGLGVHRDAGPISRAAIEACPAWDVATDFMAVHVRHATLSGNIGEQFTHPLSCVRGSQPWYFMHNGYMPTVHTLIGLPQSRFDSAEYFDYLLNSATDTLDAQGALHGLATLPPGGTSANAILIHPRCAWLIHFTPADSPYPRYFTMHRLQAHEFTICASEIHPELGPPPMWQALPSQSILEFKLTGHYEQPIEHCRQRPEPLVARHL